jgi:glyoxylase-like metal-dependent hydrolase (beta-lactamase superfamily II)
MKNTSKASKLPAQNNTQNHRGETTMSIPFPRSAFALSLASALILSAPVAIAAEATANSSEIGPAILDYPAIRIAENSYVIHGPMAVPNPHNQGFMNNPSFLIGTDGVVIVDPGSSLQTGDMVLRSVRRFTDLPVVAVFNTHHHGDHWLGNHAIRNAYPGVAIYGHPRMIERIEQGAGDAWVASMKAMTDNATRGTQVFGPNTVMNDGDVIQVAGLTFRVHHPKVTAQRSHTDNDVMLEIPERSIVFLGDNVMNQRIARMEDGNIRGNIDAIDAVLKIDAQHWVPGHGASGGREVPELFREYLNSIYTRVKKAYEEDADMLELKDMAMDVTHRFASWAGYENEVGRHAQQAWMEIEAEAF